MKDRILSTPWAAVWLPAFFALTILHAEPPYRMGSRRELFADGFMIERLGGKAEFRLHHPAPRELVLVTDKPWEGNTCGYFTIFKDGSFFRMYYRGSHSKPKTRPKGLRQVTCYAESADGIHWKRPDLGLYSFKGSRKNNIVWTGPGAHNFTPFRDSNPECPADALYKACARGTWKGKPALFAFKSPDGIHWTRMSENPIVTAGAFGQLPGQVR